MGSIQSILISYIRRRKREEIETTLSHFERDIGKKRERDIFGETVRETFFQKKAIILSSILGGIKRRRE